MTSAEQRVQALFDTVGLKVGADEFSSIANDLPTLRHQADELHRTASDGVARDTSTPTAFRPDGAAEPMAAAG